MFVHPRTANQTNPAELLTFFSLNQIFSAVYFRGKLNLAVSDPGPSQKPEEKKQTQKGITDNV